MIQMKKKTENERTNTDDSWFTVITVGEMKEEEKKNEKVSKHGHQVKTHNDNDLSDSFE